MLGFYDSKNIGGVPNKLFPLVVATTIGKFDVSRILIDGGSSCNILYSSLFEKMGLDRKSLIAYDGLNLQAFNGMTNRPLGYIELMISIREGRDIWFIKLNCTSNSSNITSTVNQQYYSATSKQPKRYTTHSNKIRERIPSWRST